MFFKKKRKESYLKLILVALKTRSTTVYHCVDHTVIGSQIVFITQFPPLVNNLAFGSAINID